MFSVAARRTHWQPDHRRPPFPESVRTNVGSNYFELAQTRVAKVAISIIVIVIVMIMMMMMMCKFP